ncbi:MAG: MFS transporter [Pirellulaceae bacterium]|nr:MAG: MFS transporter [Pirellulaceae bacterium]
MSNSGSSPAAHSRLVIGLVCFIAAVGFAFDIYELLMLPLIVRPALMELGNLRPGTPEFGRWAAVLFYVPAIAGGIFGLLGGYLTDRLGRRRVLTWSILLYAFSAFAAGYSTNLYMLLVFRCLVFVGVCVEFVAAVAWLSELFVDHRQREAALGWTQFFSSFGGLLVAVANGIASDWAQGKPAVLIQDLVTLPAVRLPEIHLPAALAFLGQIQDHAAPWRYTLMSGLIPALPLIIIRPFLPESPGWLAKKRAGTLRRPSIRALFSPELRRVTLVTTAMFACSLGAAFGAIQQFPQIVPGLPDLQAEIAKETEGLPPAEARRLKSLKEQQTAAHVQKIQEIGGLVGRGAFAVLAMWIVSRRLLIRLFQVPGLLLMPIIFAWAARVNLHLMELGAFLAGFFTVAQLSFWGNYLPRVYPIHLRGTGESFAANIGGRLIGTSFAFISNLLAAAAFIPGSVHPEKMAYTAAIVGTSVYVVGLALSFLMPEPKGSAEE